MCNKKTAMIWPASKPFSRLSLQAHNVESTQTTLIQRHDNKLTFSQNSFNKTDFPTDFSAFSCLL